MDQGYRKLEIFKRSQALAVRIHAMTLLLPHFEMYEEGSQIRRSSKSVTSNIVEGYYFRRYKAQWLLCLARSHGSAGETVTHLEFLKLTLSLIDEHLFLELHDEAEELCRMIGGFINGVSRNHRPPRD